LEKLELNKEEEGIPLAVIWEKGGEPWWGGMGRELALEDLEREFQEGYGLGPVYLNILERDGCGGFRTLTQERTGRENRGESEGTKDSGRVQEENGTNIRS